VPRFRSSGNPERGVDERRLRIAVRSRDEASRRPGGTRLPQPDDDCFGGDLIRVKNRPWPSIADASTFSRRSSQTSVGGAVVKGPMAVASDHAWPPVAVDSAAPYGGRIKVKHCPEVHSVVSGHRPPPNAPTYLAWGMRRKCRMWRGRRGAPEDHHQPFRGVVSSRRSRTGSSTSPVACSV